MIGKNGQEKGEKVGGGGGECGVAVGYFNLRRM